MAVSVCLSVCEHISGSTCPISNQFFAHVTYVRGLVLLTSAHSIPHLALLCGKFLTETYMARREG